MWTGQDHGAFDKEKEMRKPGFTLAEMLIALPVYPPHPGHRPKFSDRLSGALRQGRRQ